MGPHYRIDARIEHARDLDHFARMKRIRCGDHQHARPRNVCLDENGTGVSQDSKDLT